MARARPLPPPADALALPLGRPLARPLSRPLSPSVWPAPWRHPHHHDATLRRPGDHRSAAGGPRPGASADGEAGAAPRGGPRPTPGAVDRPGLRRARRRDHADGGLPRGAAGREVPMADWWE